VTVAGIQGAGSSALQRSDGSGAAEILEAQQLGFDIPEIGGNHALSKIQSAPDKPKTSNGGRQDRQ
jgi:hypothetical protein